MTDEPERTIEKGVERLNKIFEDELKDCHIELQDVFSEDSGISRLVIVPSNPDERESFQSNIGEGFNDEGMQAFIRGLEIAGMGDIPVKSEYDPINEENTETVELWKLDINDVIIDPESKKRLKIADCTSPGEYQNRIWSFVEQDTGEYWGTMNDKSKENEPTEVVVDSREYNMERF